MNATKNVVLKLNPICSVILRVWNNKSIWRCNTKHICQNQPSFSFTHSPSLNTERKWRHDIITYIYGNSRSFEKSAYLNCENQLFTHFLRWGSCSHKNEFWNSKIPHKKNGFIKNSVALVLTRNDHNIFRILKASYVNMQFVVFAFRFTALLSHRWVARFILLSHRNTFLTYKVCLHSFRISNYAIWALLARGVFYCVMRPVRISSMFSPAYVMYVVYRSHYNRKLFKMILNDKWIEIRRLMVW